jgi:hypothetical protein
MFERLAGVVVGLAGRRDRWAPLIVQFPSAVAFATVDGISVYERVGATRRRLNFFLGHHNARVAPFSIAGNALVAILDGICAEQHWPK